MSESIHEHLQRAAAFLRDCSPNDPCAYDNTCFAHKARWHVREALKMLPPASGVDPINDPACSPNTPPEATT